MIRLLAVFALGVAWGIAAFRFNLFPVPHIRALLARLTPRRALPRTPIACARESQFELIAGPADIVMVGDSLTHHGLWSEHFPEHRIANRGISGDTSADILARIDSVIATGARKAYVQAGTNDICRHVAEGCIVDTLIEISQRLREAGMEVIVQTVPRSRCRSVSLDRIGSLNVALHDAVRAHGFGWLDLNTTMSGPEGVRPELTYDGIHYTGLGYRAWADAIRASGGP